MTTKGLTSILGAARASIGAAIAIGAAINLMVLAAPIYAGPAIDRMLLQAGWGGLASLGLLAVAALGALAMIDEMRGRLMARIATYLEWRLAPGVPGRSRPAGTMAADAADQAQRDLGRLREAIGGPVTAVLDLPWVPCFLAALFLVHPLLGAGAVAGTALAALLAVAAVVLHRNPHAAPAARFAQMLMQVVTLAVAAGLLLTGEISIGAALAAAIVIRRATVPAQATASGWRELVETRRAFGRLYALARRDPRDSDLIAVPAASSVG